MPNRPINCPSSTLDPFSDSFLRNPFPHYETLRELGSVVWLENYDIIVMPRYEQVREALKDWETYCSSRGGGLTDFATEEPWRPPSIILEADPPLHTKTRTVLAKVLSRQSLQHLQDDFAQQASKIISKAIAKGEVDAIKELAKVFPLSVFPDAVGLTKEGRENLLPYGDMAFNAFGPRNALFEKSFVNAQKVSGWIIEQCQRKALSKGGIGEKIYHAADAGKVTEEEAGLLVRSLLTAGLDTTIYSLGAILYCFSQYPGQWQRVRQQPKLLKNAFDEAIRFVSPVQTFFRTTTKEVEVEGVLIPEGTKVLLSLASANRDPRQWENADTFDVTRKTLGHTGFGYGIHMCVGQMLAKLEADTFLTALLEQVESIESIGEPSWRLNNTLHGLDLLPVKLHAVS